MAKPRGSRQAVNEVFLDVVCILVQDCLDAVFSSIFTPPRGTFQCTLRYLFLVRT